MSHFKERKERDCLNCGTIVEGRYCHRCGQENILPKESFFGLLTHFVYDVTHFDSKFFSTLKYLLFKPGFLSLEYMKGKRTKYLHPIRMYVFTSAIFFIIFFTLYSPGKIIEDKKTRLEEKKEQLLLAQSDLNKVVQEEKDSTVLKAGITAMSSINKELSDISISLAKYNKDTAGLNFEIGSKEGEKLKLGINSDTSGIKDDNLDLNYKSVIAYQKMQEALPPKARDSWLQRLGKLQMLTTIEEARRGGQQFLNIFITNLIHSFPKLLFVSLPLFAFLLQLFYVGKKGLYYVDHAIFTIHLYCATFIFLLAWFGLLHLEEITHWGIFNIIALLSILLIYFYEYKGLRHFYGESRSVTIVKFLLLNLLSFIMIIFLLAIFTVYNAMTYSGSH